MSERPLVGIVIASHSAKLAAGVCDIVAQMAPDVAIHPAGGTDGDDIGTSFDKIHAAVTRADGGAGVVILYDLGSAKLTATLVADAVECARVVDAPLIEGAIAAAVAAQIGAVIDDVASDAVAAGRAVVPVHSLRENRADIARSHTLRNRAGLHARPAARLARIAADHGASLRIGGVTGELVEARSILAVVALGLRGGAVIRVEISGPRAGEASRAIEAAIDDGFGELAAPAEVLPAATTGMGAIGVSPGIAIGPIRRIRIAEPDLPDAPGDPDTERAALDAALAHAAGELSADSSELASAHRALLADPQLADSARAAIANGLAAAPAWWRSVREARAKLAGSPDALIAQRAVDVTDVGLRVLARIAPQHARTDLSEAASAIILADDLAPSIVEQLAAAGAAGIALAYSGPGAHAAIVARGRGIPMLVRAGAHEVADGTLAILDGTRGELVLSPDDRALDDARARRADAQRARAAAVAQAQAPVIWRGRAIAIAANVGSVAEAVLARDQGADAIGLVRTELLYLNRPDLPSEDEQAEHLAGILRAFPGREVTIRTLDVGGDKHIPALGLDPVTHGFLGLRGLRYSLAHPATLRIQLRAVLRAAAGFTGTLSVMAPMVTTAGEIVAFRAAIDAAIADLGRTPHRRPDEIGIMVETPAAALAFDTLSSHVDFASAGTNDLVQYVMSAERTNSTVAHLYLPDHPAIWRSLEALARAMAGKKLAICGEMAADPDHARRLLALGVSELSMAPASVPLIKSALREPNFTQAH